jgi:methylated-DNA-[protein]-cysteine S-methyltransferase
LLIGAPNQQSAIGNRQSAISNRQSTIQSAIFSRQSPMEKSAFKTRVLSVVSRIPSGRVATYGDVAAAAGRPRAWRAVGNIMRDCTRRDLPCHRVIAAAGRLGGYGGNVAIKRALLRAEGLLIAGSTIRDFRARRWAPPRSRRT